MKLSIITKSKIKIKIKKITTVYNKMPSSHLSQQHFYFVVMTKNVNITFSPFEFLDI